MARRRDDNPVEVFYELFMHVPTWICIPVAGAAFLVVKLTLMLLAPKHLIFQALAQNSDWFGGVAAFLILVAGFKAAGEKWVRRKIYERNSGINSIRKLSWSQFELLIGEAYRRQGYDVTETGGGGADGGVDLVLRKDGERTLVQCKQWRTFKVGVKTVRELYGVLVAQAADRAILVTSGTFTREAEEFVVGKPIRLIDGVSLKRLVQPTTSVVEAVQPEIVVPTASSAAPTPPTCPLCQSGMILRTARKGANAGSQFWGCSTYPNCRGTRKN